MASSLDCGGPVSKDGTKHLLRQLSKQVSGSHDRSAAIQNRAPVVVSLATYMSGARGSIGYCRKIFSYFIYFLRRETHW